MHMWYICIYWWPGPLKIAFVLIVSDLIVRYQLEVTSICIASAC